MKNITGKPIYDAFEKSIQKMGLCALILMLTTIGCAMVMFVFGIPMGSYSAIIPIAEIALYSIIFDRQMFKSLFINIAILAVWAFVCYSVFDWSYDGMYYHKQAIITLADGWNPLRMSSEDFNWLNGTMDLSLWLDNYPKGIWICSAAVYALTGFLETAKSVNIFIYNHASMHRLLHV